MENQQFLMLKKITIISLCALRLNVLLNNYNYIYLMVYYWNYCAQMKVYAQVIYNLAR